MENTFTAIIATVLLIAWIWMIGIAEPMPALAVPSECTGGTPMSNGGLKYDCPGGDWFTVGPGQSEWHGIPDANVLCHIKDKDGNPVNPADPARGVCIKMSS